MQKRALYFPHVSVPSTPWTTQALLYWDRLACIVPANLLYRPEQMDPRMQILLREGLSEPIIPGEYIYHAVDFDQCFLDFVEERILRRPHRLSPPQRVVTRVHAEKMGKIPQQLVKMGLASEAEWGWYEMETYLANQFMSYLASVLGALPGINATPVTDQTSIASSIGTIHQSLKRLTDNQLHTFKAKEAALNALLPIPDFPFNVDKIIKFKSTHGDLLPALRTRIESHCAEIAVLPTHEERLAASEAFLAECGGQVREIEEAMRATFPKIVMGALTPLFGAGLPRHASPGAQPSLAGAAYQAIASIRGPRLAQESRPLAYVVRAQKKFSSGRP